MAGIIRLKEVFQPHPTMFQIAYEIHDIALDIFKHFFERFHIFTADVQHKLNEIFLFSLHMPIRLYVCKNPYNIKK